MGLKLRLRGLLLNQVLLLLPRGLDRQDSLTVLVLHHLQRDLGVPALVLRAPKVDLLALGHHHSEVHILALALHAVHGLHVGKVQFLELGWRLEAGHGRPSRLGRFGRPLPRLLLLLLVLQLLGRDKQQPLLGEDAALFLPELQQPVAALLQHTLLQRFAATALQHPPGIGRSAARLGLSTSSRPSRGQQQQPRAVLAPAAPAAARPERAEEANTQEAERRRRRRRLRVPASQQPRPDAPQGPGAANLPASAVLLRALTEGHWPGPLTALLNGPASPPPSDTQRKRRLLAPAPRGKAQLGKALCRRRTPH